MLRYVAERPLPLHRVLPTADELMAWGALRAAQLSEHDSPCDTVWLTPNEMAERLRATPRCSAAVVAGGYLGVALNASRERAYAVLRALFAHVPFRSDLHPTLIAIAGRAGLIAEPRWVSWAVAGSPVDPLTTALALTTAAYRAWGPKVARELWSAFMAPALPVAVETLPA